jgi:hypothetical protein
MAMPTCNRLSEVEMAVTSRVVLSNVTNPSISYCRCHVLEAFGTIQHVTRIQQLSHVVNVKDVLVYPLPPLSKPVAKLLDIKEVFLGRLDSLPHLSDPDIIVVHGRSRYIMNQIEPQFHASDGVILQLYEIFARLFPGTCRVEKIVEGFRVCPKNSTLNSHKGNSVYYATTISFRTVHDIYIIRAPEKMAIFGNLND